MSDYNKIIELAIQNNNIFKTKMVVDAGIRKERIKEMLTQPQYNPMPVEYQVIIIYAATRKHLLDIAVEDILRFEKELFEFIQTKYSEIPESIKEEKVITEDIEAKLVQAIEEVKKDFK